MGAQYDRSKFIWDTFQGNPNLSLSEVKQKVADKFDCSLAAAGCAIRRVFPAGNRPWDNDPLPEEPGVSLSPDEDEDEEPDRWELFREYLRERGANQIPSDPHGGSKNVAVHLPSLDQYAFMVSGFSFFTLSEEVVTDICEWYPDRGAGMTQKEVCRAIYKKHRLEDPPITHKRLQKILFALNMERSSQPFPPHAYRGQTVGQMSELFREKQEALLELKHHETQRQFYQKKFMELKRKVLEYDTFVRDLIDEAEIRPLPKFDIDAAPILQGEFSGGRTDILLISDWHYGLVVDREGQNIYNSDIAEDRMKRLVAMLSNHYHHYNRPLNDLVIAFAGDMIEGVNGNMRPGQWLHEDRTGLDQVIGAADISAYLVRACEAILPEHVGIKVKCVVGNHGRSSRSYMEDPQRLPESAMYEMARRSTEGGRSEWNICPASISKYKVEGIQVVQCHGDKAPKDLKKLGWSHMDEYVLIISGHMHSVATSSSRHVLHVQNGSGCGVTDFEADQLGKVQRPGQCLIEVYRDHGPVPGRVFYLD